MWGLRYYNFYRQPSGGNLSGGSTPWNLERETQEPIKEKYPKPHKMNQRMFCSTGSKRQRNMNSNHRGGYNVASYRN